MKNGEWRGIYDNGATRYIIHYTDDEKDGEEVRYFPNGNIELRQSYSNGLLNGKYERRNEAGAIVEKGQFANGEKEGKWVWYDGNKVVYQAKFKAGKEVK